MLIFVFGGVGAVFRYYLSELIVKYNRRAMIPIHTLIINITGSFLLGFVLNNKVIYSIEISDAITFGFLGAFTTFSSFSLELVQIYRKNNINKLVIYSIFSIFGSLFALYVGISI
ncbi:MAG: CrcB family protein [Bacillales bacterium]|jgi:CrcB protein|nr:CrcB family protein [Bacillales bacterium]